MAARCVEHDAIDLRPFETTQAWHTERDHVAELEPVAANPHPAHVRANEGSDRSGNQETRERAGADETVSPAQDDFVVQKTPRRRLFGEQHDDDGPERDDEVNDRRQVDDEGRPKHGLCRPVGHVETRRARRTSHTTYGT